MGTPAALGHPSLGRVSGMETHLSVSGLGQTEAIFSEDILAASDRLMEHEKDFGVLMWNMSVAWGFPELPKRCTHSHAWQPTFL